MTPMNTDKEKKDLSGCRDSVLRVVPEMRSSLGTTLSTESWHPENALPVPNAPISVRPATREDIPFIDALQKQYSKALGFFPRAQMEGYIDNGWTLIAEMNGSPVGFCASRDRYLKRDELGVVYQLCVSPSAQRGLFRATLLKEVFARSAYGCKQFCCWCAQDLAANRFWESLGFVPIAFRGGSAKKSRVHIFWQKRIRANDHSTPWWFPAKTDGGAIREDRLVLPIPPGVRWDEAMPVMVAPEAPKAERARRAAKVKAAPPAPPLMPRAASRFGPPGAMPIVAALPEPIAEPLAIVKSIVPALTRERRTVDPKMIAAARELSDRYLEQVNASPMEAGAGKYEVSRSIESDVTLEVVPLLPTTSAKMLAAA